MKETCRPGARWLGAPIVVVFLCNSGGPLAAHGSRHDQIARASRAIAGSPADARLYLARGELHRAHHDTRRALDDYAAALRLDPQLDVVRLARGRLLAAAGRPAEALADLDRFLARCPEHPAARVARGRARDSIGQLEGALADYERALGASSNPDWFLERARVARRLPAGGAAQSLRGLEQALARVGPVPALVFEAVDVAMRAGRELAALEYLDMLLKTAPQHPLWLSRHGEILAAAGRHAEAGRAFAAALAAIDGLPPPRRGTRQMVAARQRIVVRLNDVDSRPAPSQR